MSLCANSADITVLVCRQFWILCLSENGGYLVIDFRANTLSRNVHDGSRDMNNITYWWRSMHDKYTASIYLGNL